MRQEGEGRGRAGTLIRKFTRVELAVEAKENLHIQVGICGAVLNTEVGQ